jgi:flagellar protein FliS
MTYSGNPATYQAQAAMTATPGGLVLMLFDGALAAIAKAQYALDPGESRDLELAHRELTRAQDILTELQVSLDHEAGGRISTSLSSLYLFCIEQLVGANVSKNAGSLPAVAHILGELRVAFAAATEQATAA